MSYSMGDSVGYIKLNIQDFMRKYEEVHSKTESLDKIALSMSDIFTAAGKAVVAAFAGISAAATAATKSVITVGSSFQASMSQVAATMGMTADQIRNGSEDYERLAATAKELGASTKYSATQAAESLNFLALAGYSVDESISTLPKVLDVAAAGGMDLARASDMVTDAMSALGLPLEQAGEFVDKLAKTSQKSNTSVAQLGEAILQIGGTAKSLAGGVTELDTALGILANNGIKAAEGGTALRQVILNLTAPTKQAQEFMDSLGISAYDASGNMKPLNETFAELSQIMEGMTQQEKDNVLTQIFDARQLKSARALLAGYSESWNELYANIENADGAAHNMAQTMQENLTGAITIAKSAIEGVQVTAFEALETGLTKSVKVATGAIDELNKTLQTPEMQEALQKIGTMLGDILSKFAEFVANEAIPKMIEWFSKLDETANTVKSALAGVGAALPIVTFGLVACNQVVQAFVASQIAAKVATLATNAALLANPYTAVAVAVGVLVAKVVEYFTEMKRVIETARTQETEFTKAAEAARENAKALEEAKEEAEKNVEATNEQIGSIKSLVEQLGEYANKTELSNGELAIAKTLIEKLNELYPENTAYIEDGQIKAYDKLKESVRSYCDELYIQAQIEAEIKKNMAARETRDTAEQNLANLGLTAEKVNELGDAYRKAKNAREYYDKYGAFTQKGTNPIFEKAQKEADALKMTLKEYYVYQEELALNASLAASEAWSINNIKIAESEKLIEESEKKIDELRNEDNEKATAEAEKTRKELEGIYASQLEAQVGTNKKYADEMAKQSRRSAKQQQRTTEQMWKDIDELDRKYKLGQIQKEEDYQEQRKQILESNRMEYDDKWVDEYSKSLNYEKELQEEEIRNIEERNKEKQEAEKEKLDEQQRLFAEEIDQRIEDLRYRNRIDESYTKEMMYNDMQTIVNGLDKNSEIYKQYNDEIIAGRKDLNVELIEENKKRSKEEQALMKADAEKAFSAWSNSYDSLVNEAESAYEEIASKQDELSKSLIDSVKLYETETVKVWNSQKRAFEDAEVFTASANSIKQQTKDIENYTKTLQELEERGLSDDLMSKILSMGQEEGAKYAAALSKMSDSELQNYSSAYEEMIEKSKEFSERYYASQIETLDKDFKQKFETLYSQIPEDIRLVGQESIDGFIQGVQAKSEESAKQLQSVMLAGVDAVKNALGIHSPSKVYEDIGKNSMQGFINGLTGQFKSTFDKFTELGKKCGDSFTAAFNSAWRTFSNNLPSTISTNIKPVYSLEQMQGAIADHSIYTGYDNGNANKSAEPSNVIVQGRGLSIKDVETAIKNAMPSGDVVLTVDGMTFGKISRRELNKLAQGSGRLGLNV